MPILLGDGTNPLQITDLDHDDQRNIIFVGHLTETSTEPTSSVIGRFSHDECEVSWAQSVTLPGNEFISSVIAGKGDDSDYL